MQKPYGLSLVSFFLGLTIGLIIAAYIAFYVTKTPVPFVDRLNDTNLIDPKKLNNSNSEADGVIVKVLPEKEVIFPPDEMESLINKVESRISDSEKNKKNIATMDKKKKDTAPVEVITQKKSVVDSKKKIKTYYLQVGAFRSMEEAERMRAKLAFLGFEASLYKKTKPGSIFYRVRLGAFNSEEELNRVKKRLSDGKIKSHTVVGEKN